MNTMNPHLIPHKWKPAESKGFAYVAIYDSCSNLGNQGETIIARDTHWTPALEAAFDAVQLQPHQYAQGWYSDNNQVTCLAFKRA